ncbi:uncharacterized protein Bfra_005203 [Botrytis fragariae]|uniref:Ribosome biogenesis protein ALB1 n=5 Tax=Botrytis TaxID=33196 RepID=A0A8H6AUI2_9HELO|nr:uncharacterized protein Bfra_005203 [Botrytis fragariae]XP_038757110.1 uncharacterized protein EAF02_006741 [Botrytis sinoallii]XP_038814408.1 uncharacterized protein EAE98_001804 [Botrytis deweyae]KAF7897371.1 hypothetical protein EAF00_005599 [Botryotinia globosa]KAF7930893.1 hypothetical protein EAE99_004143 [Botrytis elliptica]TGO30444.1 hypothetical protein BPAE_0005g00390 [Botrytis paeoniae]TGO33727.1 hypothetical protein BHYA_0230g00150 [Botrytis hyacinthi]KAF5873739.1 hypothetical
MASKSNPNVPQKKRKIANRAKTQRKNAINKITKNPRGTRASTVLHPTSGPLAPLSGKKARKVQKAQNCARQRALEQAMKEGEVKMTDAPETTSNAANEGMDVDNIA